MQRRKFLIGMGSLAAGSAAAMGTGAFTTASADRAVDVNVVGDGSAYLGLSAASGPNGDYVDDSGDEVIVDFGDISQNDEGSNAGTGSGVGHDSSYDMDNVLTITNQGTQEVTVSLDTSSFPSEVSASLNASSSTDDDGDGDTFDLDVGDSVDVDFQIDTPDSATDIDTTLTIKADA
ncbi:hypothetical protein EGH21_04500 [Halomicroarcula sp. F13]|uniref:DUF1102 domain-containing protein n=1 Tax=Haloarcula rubra TaxID=2487747 RepID=A0AAW4PMJ3_9EURY|nr:hypothetical protein [Halomicroarcula rubra]MBX0322292.1 hypothetical protein [Halomicroarcula rubra]